MRKVLIAWLVSFAFAMLSPASALAADASGLGRYVSVDEVTVTVSENCALSTTGHTAGDGSWSSNTLSATRSGGSVSYNIGATTFSVTCNNSSGYRVVVTTSDLVHSSVSTVKIPAYTGTSYSSEVSGWAPANGSAANSTKYESGDVVETYGSSVSGRSFTIYYGVGISSVQPAGTYTSNSAATYTLTTI